MIGCATDLYMSFGPNGRDAHEANFMFWVLFLLGLEVLKYSFFFSFVLLWLVVQDFIRKGYFGVLILRKGLALAYIKAFM